MIKKLLPLLIIATLGLGIVGCSGGSSGQSSAGSNNSSESEELGSLSMQFGGTGEVFTIELEDNETSRAIARHVGRQSWDLPIYNYDSAENYEVMQYYDVPSRYNIPSNPETITSQSAGELYYSAPNRIVLFYNDAEVTGEFTKVGDVTNTENLASSVEENPVVSGGSNKIISISPGR